MQETIDMALIRSILDYRVHLWIQARGWCGICYEPVPWPVGRDTEWMATAQRDHIVPKSRGGSHDDDNLQLAHASCNSRKNAYTDWPRNRHRPDFPGHRGWAYADGPEREAEYLAAVAEREREWAERRAAFEARVEAEIATWPWESQLQMRRFLLMTAEQRAEEQAFIDDMTGGVTF
jgi:hypothetical protein